MTKTSDPVAIARKTYEAYVAKNRTAIEALIADDFHFTSPLDNRLNRATYFERCWPNSESISGFDFINLVPHENCVFVTYEGRNLEGKKFRNTEILTIRNDKVVDAEVYFGWSIPHKAQPGGFVADNDQPQAANVGMLIRRSIADVFEAFINPKITTNFWFTKSSGRLEAGKQVMWEWEMYGHSTEVSVRAIEPNKRIVIEWQGYTGPTTVEWTFAPHDDATFVSITESGWIGEPDELRKYVISSTEGFTLVLAGAKAFLEHNIQLNLVGDRFPK